MSQVVRRNGEAAGTGLGNRPGDEECELPGWVLSVERTIPATPEETFAVLTDTTQHSAIDGPSMLPGKTSEEPQWLSLGATFGLSTKMPRMPYSTVNRVVEFEQNRPIAWPTGPRGTVERFIAGRIWRYELEPVEGGLSCGRAGPSSRITRARCSSSVTSTGGGPPGHGANAGTTQSTGVGNTEDNAGLVAGRCAERLGQSFRAESQGERSSFG